jgi:hypothetical protein
MAGARGVPLASMATVPMLRINPYENGRRRANDPPTAKEYGSNASKA